MDKESLKLWLAAEGRDRVWLATQLGSTKGSVDQWFSRGFPEWAEKSIERLMNPGVPVDNSGFEVNFTAREFERIEEARKLLGIATRKLFYEEAINEYASQVIAREAAGAEADKTPRPAKIVYYVDNKPSSMVAENITPYVSSSGGKEKKKQHTDKTGTED